MQPRTWNGFTLVELLVVIAIIGVLIALLLPAIQAAREAARRSQCANNLHQLAVAVHNYADSHRTFPPGFITGAPQDDSAPEPSLWSWGAMLLPFVEQAPLHNLLKVGSRTLQENLQTPAGLAALQTPLGTFMCPSDTGPALNDFNEAYAPDPSNPQAVHYRRQVTPDGSARVAIAKSNYVGVACSSVSTTPAIDPAPYGPATGVFFENSATQFSEITDGTSNTLMLGERPFRIGDLNVGAANALGFSPLLSEFSSRNRAITCVLGIPYYGINHSSGNTNDVHESRAFHSLHPGGAMFALCDGSTRFLSQTIDYNPKTVPSSTLKNGAWVDSTLERLCAKNDGQPLADF